MTCIKASVKLDNPILRPMPYQFVVGLNKQDHIEFLEFQTAKQTIHQIAQNYGYNSVTVYDSRFHHTVTDLINKIENPTFNFAPILSNIKDEYMELFKYIQGIPMGHASNYSELGEMIKKHPRAVAKMCGQNKHAVLIPCHRVIAKSGDLSGYKWQIDLKRKLLRKEGFKNGKIC